MPGSPYRTPPHVAAPTPVAYHPDDSALPMIALVILFAALAPPLSFGVVSIWDAWRPASGAAEMRVQKPRAAQAANQPRRAPPRRSDL